MLPLTDYIEKQAEVEQDILYYLHGMITTCEAIRSKLNYGIPFYYGKKWICYLNVVRKSGGVELAFLQAQHFPDPHGLLQARGRKMVKGIVFHSLEEIPDQAIRDILAAAIAYDRTL